ncbi:MAG: hypothetical protein RMJ28_00025 [Nitrososphaerota archaeon]|nr:hypothetical protein [Candidatus Calditenuaceae archaeon]MDW8072619.1 hypothetical protein [Nitrososphaerota archaeon]
MRNGGRTIVLGLNLPMFVAGLVAMGMGTLVGMLGIWGAAAWGKPVPEWEKVGHAHSSWWGILIMIASLVLPSLGLKPWVKKLIVAGTFVGPTLWIGVLATYYEIGGPTLWRLEAPTAPGTYYDIPVIGLAASGLELLGFVALGLVALSAIGLNIPLLSTKEAPPKSRYEFLTEIQVPRRIFVVPTIAIIVSVLVGFALTALFKAVHQPISPSALVQLHDHAALLATSALLVLLVMHVFDVRERTRAIGIRLMEISLPLTIVGLLVFNLTGVHSIVWVAPAGIYYLLLLLAVPVSLGFYSWGEPPASGARVTAFNIALGVCFVGLVILVATGAYIALNYDTTPNVTVTYKQPQGSPYPGPYPAVYIGTAPAVNTPRGLENAHLSPGSWYHAAIAWLLILSMFGTVLIGEKRPGLLYLFAFTIPLAPTFNMLGRFLAWLGIPNGIGALWFAGHPLKGFNLISLFVITVIALIILSRRRQ